MNYVMMRKESQLAVNDYSEFFNVPQVDRLVVNHIKGADYCGILESTVGAETRMLLSSKMTINYPNIISLAEIDKIPIKQALTETLYHEWLHYLHAFCFPEDYEMKMCHEGEFWEELVEVGLDMKFIIRKDI